MMARFRFFKESERSYANRTPCLLVNPVLLSPSLS